MADPLVRLPFDDSHRLTQGFGENPSVYAQFGIPGHNGIDWSLSQGTPVLAVDAGKVIAKTEDKPGFGQYIKLQHSWGQTLYAHLSGFKIKKNQNVQAGQVIGLSGNTGFSTGPHLHFGMRVNPYSTADGWNGYTNPQRFLIWPGENTADAQLQKLQQRLQQVQQALQDAQGSFEFERTELHQTADLWREGVQDLLKQYLPGELPPDADVLAMLTALIESWAQELDVRRRAEIDRYFES